MPAYDGRRFVAVADQTLGEALRLVWNEFTPDTKLIAQQGVEGVISKLRDEHFPTMVGLLEIALIAEVTGAFAMLTQIGRQLVDWDESGDTIEARIATSESVAAFREIGETAFRLLVAHHDLNSVQEYLRPFGEIAHRLLLGGRFSRAAVPALAPFFVIGAVYSTSQSDVKKMERTLAATYLSEDHPFPEFYVFRRQTDPEIRYAFDVWSLPAMLTSVGGGRTTNVLRPRLTNVLEAYVPSATMGVPFVVAANDDEDFRLYEDILSL